MEIDQAILGAIIGGFLAAISGVVLYFLQKWWERKKLNQLFITAIKDDLTNSIPLYEKIKSTGKSQKFIPFESIIGLKKSRQIYEKFQEHLLLIEPYTLRKRIFDYYLQSATLIDKLEIYQNRVHAIRGSYNATLRRVREENPSLNEEQIVEKTLQLNQHEAQEHTLLTSETFEQLNNLDTIKIEAQLILDKLSD